MSLSSVDWSAFLQSGSIVPTDINFSLVDQQLSDHNLMSPNSSSTSAAPPDQTKVTTFTAHKQFLAAASPVFATQFFGSLPEKNKDVVLTDVTARAFKTMLEFVYGRNVTLLEESTVNELFEALYVADKYLINQMKEFIEDKLKRVVIGADNVVEVARAALVFKHFDKASSILVNKFKDCFVILSSEIEEMFILAINFQSEDLLVNVLICLNHLIEDINEEDDISDDDMKLFWYGFQTVQTICKDTTMSRSVQSEAQAIVDICVYKFQEKETHKKILMSVSQSSPERKNAFFEMLNLVEQGFCSNCKFSPCQHGKQIWYGKVKAGCKVKEPRDFKRIGYVMVGKFNTIEILKQDEDNENFVDAECTPYFKVKLTDNTVIFATMRDLLFSCK